MNILEFSAPQKLKNFLSDVEPVPIKTNIPQWYKKLQHNIDARTVKGCIPFLDALTAGYLFKMPQDLHIQHNVWNEEKKQKDSFFRYSVKHDSADIFNLNKSDGLEVHPQYQVEGSPMLEKNSNLPIYKIINPFRIKTPNGYSCLFTSPLNNKDDRFEIISGIVDTDQFETEINFPIVINGDKYSELDTIIERGTPIAQVIPFKREDWKLEVNYEKRNMSYNMLYPFYTLKKFVHNYKTFVWRKKKWM